MSKFSEHLEQCILNSGMTEGNLAKISGFNRSYIALMKNGQRISPDAGKMMKLIQALNLPPSEYDQLWSEYIRAEEGEAVYERNHAVLELMQSFCNLSGITIQSTFQHEIRGIKTVEHPMDVDYLLRAVMEQEAGRQDGYIRIIMQPDIPVLKNLLPSLCKNNKNLKIDHIICLNHETGNEKCQNELYNIRMLQAVVPVIIFGDNPNYNIFHYYDRVISHLNQESLLPYLIVTEEFAVCMNTTGDKAILFQEKEMITFYDRLFQEHKKRCAAMVRKIENETEFYELFRTDSESEDTFYTIAQQPCFGVLKVEHLVKKYYDRGNDRTRLLLEEILRKNERLVSGGKLKNVSYCTKEGLKRFAEEGIVDELPKELYRILQKEDRIYILQQLVEALQNGGCEVYILENNAVKFPAELKVYSRSITDTALVYFSDREQARFLLKESSIARMIYEFFQSFMKNPEVCEKEKSIRYLQSLIDSMERKK